MFCCGGVESGCFANAKFGVVGEVDGVCTQEEIYCDGLVCVGSDGCEKCGAFCVVVWTLKEKVSCRFGSIGAVWGCR